MIDHVANRDKVIEALKEELVGPTKLGEEIDCTKEIVFEKVEDAWKPYCQASNNEEILQRDPPLNRYGTGVLYPYGEVEKEMEGIVSDEETLNLFDDGIQDENIISAQAEKEIEKLIEKTDVGDDDSDLDLSSANKYLPSSMGISFLAEFPKDAKLIVEATGGRYIKKEIHAGERKFTWWLRVPVHISAQFNADDILHTKGKVNPSELKKENSGDLDLRIEVYSRPRKENQQRLITVCLINRTEKYSQKDTACLFQTHFRAHIISPEGKSYICPYPEAEAQKLDEEEQSLAMLYRNVQTFAVGHGCAADWEKVGDENRAVSVSAECFPVCETPSITPDIFQSNGQKLEISMLTLAGLDSTSDGMAELESLVKEYEIWIEERQKESLALDAKYQEAVKRHLQDFKRCAKRMRDGLRYLKENSQAQKAFRLANHAVLLQQVRGLRETRELQFDESSQSYKFTESYPTIEASMNETERGKWRAFQVAFLLMSIRSAAESDAPDRETVELIWFPTGGGKTEAYLGLTAFSLFMRRLKNKEDAGVHVIMRYTLRLLTAQQFQRACGLICAMEHLRRNYEDELGTNEFSIAVWLGNNVTPGTREDAKRNLRELQGKFANPENKFIVLRCPWCRARMGRIKAEKRGKKKETTLVPGYEPSNQTVVFKCPDRQCDFHNGLPIYVIDEDIYECCPSLVIGTVDKFAMLAWNHRARALFGINDEGKRFCSPPGLIIQDELHLISGPLGSVVGLYETLIEELCTDRRKRPAVQPKIISSTATIRRFEAQIKALYARGETMLFPPPGLDAGDSFFAKYARNDDGTLAPGRKYVGVNAPGLGSLQNTEVRTYSALMQAPFEWTSEEQDPWWTLLIFFNNLRMLGNTLSLFQSNVPAHLLVLKNRTRKTVRHINIIKELTGRLRSDEVPVALAELETVRKTEDSKAVDVCLASNIIEVGVDVERLSLMVVVGQPKSTSQYIQVTGRVGRKRERPGLVVSIYSPSKPRDRSHYEKFRSYHERLYAQVEPTSVTPFSPPVLDRTLQAVMAGYVRQFGDKRNTESPYPFPEELIEQLYDLVLSRVEIVDANEKETLIKTFEERKNEWMRWERTRWDSGFAGQMSESALLRPAGAWVNKEDEKVSWATPQSMRNVDAESQVQITNLYIHD